MAAASLVSPMKNSGAPQAAALALLGPRMQDDTAPPPVPAAIFGALPLMLVRAGGDKQGADVLGHLA